MTRRRSAPSLATELMLAPMVIGMRLPLLAIEAQKGTLMPGTETVRAVTEKATAVMEGTMKAQISMMHSAMRFWPEVLSGQVPSLFSGASAEQAMHAALRPAGRTVRANYKRLSTRR